jgi:hypothetical protein
MPIKCLFPFWNLSLIPITRIFTKTLTAHDIMKKARDENYKILVIEASFGEYFGFNMKVKKQQAIAMKIMSPNEHDNFMIVGWKASKTLPKWVGNAGSWIDFLCGKKLDENEVFETDELKNKLTKEIKGRRFKLEPEQFTPEVTVKHYHMSSKKFRCKMMQFPANSNDATTGHKLQDRGQVEAWWQCSKIGSMSSYLESAHYLNSTW